MAKIKVPTVNEKLLDKYIRHAIYMEQLKASEAAAISNFLKKETFPQLYNKLITELSKVKSIESIGSLNKIKRLKQMMASIDKIITAGAIRAGDKLNKRLYNIAEFEARWNKNIIEKTVPVDIDFTMPSNQVLRQLVLKSSFQGHKMQAWMQAYSKSVQAGIIKQLRTGIATGESIPQLSNRLTKLLGSKSKQSGVIARTAVSHIVHRARETTFKQNKKLINKVQWISTLDDRTTLICINLDNKIFEVGEGERPPAHFQCRSTVVPVITSWQEFGVDAPPPATRASMNGSVPANTNYRDWLKNQSKATQIKVLGKKRAELYQSGRVTIDRFVSKNLEPLSLKQLAKREGLDAKIVSKGKFPTARIHNEFSVDMRDRFLELNKKFPKAAKRIQDVKVLSAKDYNKFNKESTSLASVQNKNNKDIIYINGKYFGADSKLDVTKGLKQMNKSHWLVSKTSQDVLTHEYGHVVFDSLKPEAKSKLAWTWFQPEKGFKAKIKKQISKYAATSYNELFAEAFTQWQIGKASPMAKKILKITGVMK